MKLSSARFILYASIVSIPNIVFAAAQILFYNLGMIAILNVFLLIIIIGIEYIFRHSHKQFYLGQPYQNNELYYFAYEYNDEILIMLNKYAEIISFNKTFMQMFYYQPHELYERPFRDLIHPNFSNRRIYEKLLTKLKEVFQGNQTQFICTCKRSGDDEPISIRFRFIPIMNDNEIQNILVIGTPLQPDTIARKYLVHESSYYVIDNDLSIIFLLCHRLTRNLEDRLPRNIILMAQIALQEVFLNAIEHGNLEINYERKTQLKAKSENYWELLLKECDKEHLKNRKIYVSYYMDNNKVIYKIKDEGKGFDWKKYMHKNNVRKSNDLLHHFHGIGLEIVKSVFDIRFNKKGNEITLIKEFPNQYE